MPPPGLVRPPLEMRSYVNPEATGHEGALPRVLAVRERLLGLGSNLFIFKHVVSHLDILSIGDTQTLVNSDGGDATTRSVLAAVIGIVPDKPELTALNFEQHQQIAKNIYFYTTNYASFI